MDQVIQILVDSLVFTSLYVHKLGTSDIRGHLISQVPREAFCFHIYGH